MAVIDNPFCGLGILYKSFFDEKERLLYFHRMKDFVFTYKATLAYILIIPLTAWLFLHLPVFTVAEDMQWSPASLLFGFVFVARDYAQREIGKYIFAAMAFATILTFVFATKELAMVAAVSFLFSELADWLVFTFTKLKMSWRILLSGCVAVPVDSALALYGLNLVMPGVLGFQSIWLLIAIKMIATLGFFFVLFAREQQNANMSEYSKIT